MIPEKETVPAVLVVNPSFPPLVPGMRTFPVAGAMEAAVLEDPRRSSFVPVTCGVPSLLVIPEKETVPAVVFAVPSSPPLVPGMRWLALILA